MLSRISALLASLAATSAVASYVWTRSSIDVRPTVNPTTSLAQDDSPVDELNKVIQERFHNFSRVGMMRMPTVHEQVRLFKPETVPEKAAVAAVEKNQWEVSLYLVGRESLASDPSESEWKADSSDHHREITGPLDITESTSANAHPSEWELREQGRKALIDAASGDSFKSTIGRWKLDARPVRADRQACLKCHSSEGATDFSSTGEKRERPLRVGDALGVVLYLYAPNPK